MTKKKLLEELSSYKKAFIGIGGSGIEGNDVDLIWIEDSINFDEVNKVRERLTRMIGKRVSIVPMTTMMLNDPALWGSKFATMHIKGIQWIREPQIPNFSYGDLKILIKNEAPFFLNHWMKLLANGQKDKDKAITLLLQEIALLTKNN